MNLRLLLVAAVLSLTFGLPRASAALIVSLVGDEDNFSWTAADPPLMDIETADFPHDYVHTYVLGSLVPTSAWLEVHWSGVGTCCGDDQILVNGNQIWLRADSGGPGDPAYNPETLIISFALGYLGLGGSETVTIGISNGDNVMLDYVKLGLTDDPVPEPGTWMLAGIGLLALAATRARRRR